MERRRRRSLIRVTSGRRGGADCANRRVHQIGVTKDTSEGVNRLCVPLSLSSGASRCRFNLSCCSHSSVMLMIVPLPPLFSPFLFCHCPLCCSDAAHMLSLIAKRLEVSSACGWLLSSLPRTPTPTSRSWYAQPAGDSSKRFQSLPPLPPSLTLLPSTPAAVWLPAPRAWRQRLCAVLSATSTRSSVRSDAET